MFKKYKKRNIYKLIILEETTALYYLEHIICRQEITQELVGITINQLDICAKITGGMGKKLPY